MTRYLFSVILFFIFTSCGSLNKQGILGQLDWVTGNQMPGPDKKPEARQGVVREVQIYELLDLNDVEIEGVFIKEINKPLVKTVLSDSNGNFKVSLTPGSYSILIKEANGLFANQFDQNTEQQYSARYRKREGIFPGQDYNQLRGCLLSPCDLVP